MNLRVVCFKLLISTIITTYHATVAVLVTIWSFCLIINSNLNLHQAYKNTTCWRKAGRSGVFHYCIFIRAVGGEGGQSELRLSRWLRRQWAMIASTSNFSASTTTHHRHAPAPPTISCCCCWHAASMETVIDRPHPAAVRCRPPAAVAYQNMDSRSRQQRLLGGRVSHWVNLTDDTTLCMQSLWPNEIPRETKFGI